MASMARRPFPGLSTCGPAPVPLQHWLRQCPPVPVVGVQESGHIACTHKMHIQNRKLSEKLTVGQISAPTNQNHE